MVPTPNKNVMFLEPYGYFTNFLFLFWQCIFVDIIYICKRVLENFVYGFRFFNNCLIVHKYYRKPVGYY